MLEDLVSNTLFHPTSQSMVLFPKFSLMPKQEKLKLTAQTTLVYSNTLFHLTHECCVVYLLHDTQVPRKLQKMLVFNGFVHS